MRVTIIDTSVLCEYLAVPGRCDHPDRVQAELKERVIAGERFVVPITAVIETGNFIAQIKDGEGDRRAASERFAALLEQAARQGAPFVLHRVTWDDEFLAELRKGNGTGTTLCELAAGGKLGAGDVAILVERDRVLFSSASSDAHVWTLDRKLEGYNKKLKGYNKR